MKAPSACTARGQQREVVPLQQGLLRARQSPSVDATITGTSHEVWSQCTGIESSPRVIRRLPKADVAWLSQQLSQVVQELMPSSEECSAQAAAFDRVRGLGLRVEPPSPPPPPPRAQRHAVAPPKQR